MQATKRYLTLVLADLHREESEIAARSRSKLLEYRHLEAARRSWEGRDAAWRESEEGVAEREGHDEVDKAIRACLQTENEKLAEVERQIGDLRDIMLAYEEAERGSEA